MITPSYLPAVRYGGTIYSVHALCKALIEIGVDVKVVTTNVDGNEDSAVDLNEFVVVDGVPVHYFQSKGLLRRIYYSKAMKRYLDAHAIDYEVLNVNAAFLWPNSYVARVAKKANRPWVWTPRGMLVKSLFSQKSAWFKWPWWWLEGQKLAREANLVHCTSRIELDDIDELCPEAKCAIISNGVELPEPVEIERKTNQILYIGRISWKKRIDLLIESLVVLAQEVPNVRLIIAGNDEEGLTDRLRLQAQGLGVDNRIDFMGSVSTDERDRLMAESTALALVSEQENFGNVVVEALALSCPCVVTEGCGAKEVVLASEGGYVVEQSEHAVAKALGLLLTDIEESRRLGENGAKFVKVYCRWTIKARELRDEYARLMKEQKAL